MSENVSRVSRRLSSRDDGRMSVLYCIFFARFRASLAILSFFEINTHHFQPAPPPSKHTQHLEYGSLVLRILTIPLGYWYSMYQVGSLGQLDILRTSTHVGQ